MDGCWLALQPASEMERAHKQESVCLMSSHNSAWRAPGDHLETTWRPPGDCGAGCSMGRENTGATGAWQPNNGTSMIELRREGRSEIDGQVNGSRGGAWQAQIGGSCGPLVFVS
jgi:hypothetical protein